MIPQSTDLDSSLDVAWAQPLPAIYERRAVRSYTPAAVSESAIRALLDAAVHAPTAMHEEPWRFVVVQDRAVLKRISDQAKSLAIADAGRHGNLLKPPGASGDGIRSILADASFNIFYDANTLVVICARLSNEFVVADCWLAAENFMLAATADGLGTCVIGFAVAALNTPETKALLGLPADLTAVAPIIVGEPARYRVAGAAEAGRGVALAASLTRHVVRGSTRASMRRLLYLILAIVSLGFVTQTDAVARRVRTPALRIIVNIPAFRLDAFVADSLVRTIPIAVGMPAFKSPRGVFGITSIEWNPWWNPPNSPWAAKEKRTPPGPANPMGKVKLNFRPSYFLHGTPLDQSIGSAASHGCIRMRSADAIALARLVHRFGSPGMTEEDIDRLAAETATRSIELEIPVPIELRYERVEVRNDSLFAYRDIYGLATHSLYDDVITALVAKGVDRAGIDTIVVRSVTRSVRQHGNSVPLARLVR